MRIALDDAAPLYRNAPEAHAARAAGSRVILNFLEELLPHASPEQRTLAGDLIESTMSQVGKSFSETSRSKDEIARYANAMADMFCAYLEQIQHASPS